MAAISVGYGEVQELGRMREQHCTYRKGSFSPEERRNQAIG